MRNVTGIHGSLRWLLLAVTMRISLAIAQTDINYSESPDFIVRDLRLQSSCFQQDMCVRRTFKMKNFHIYSCLLLTIKICKKIKNYSSSILFSLYYKNLKLQITWTAFHRAIHLKVKNHLIVRVDVFYCF